MAPAIMSRWWCCCLLYTSQDVGNAVAFLCSDAASYLTGMFLEITGGKFCVQNPDYAWKMLNRD